MMCKISIKESWRELKETRERKQDWTEEEGRLNEDLIANLYDLIGNCGANKIFQSCLAVTETLYSSPPFITGYRVLQEGYDCMLASFISL